MSTTVGATEDEVRTMRAVGRVHWANFVRRNADEKPTATAVRHRGVSHSWAELDDRVARTAAVLTELGVGRGDRVALLLTNIVEYVELAVATMAVGAICVPVNFRLTAAEAGYILGDSGAKVLFVEDSLVETGRAGLDVAGIAAASVVVGGEGPDRYADLVGRAVPVREIVDVPEADPCLILYTSGTTGRPKGAVLTHHAMQQQAITMIRSWRLTGEDDRYLCATPLFHAAGMGALGSFLLVGSTVVLHPTRPFDANDILDTVLAEQVTILFLVPTQWHDLVACARVRERTGSVRLIGWGSAPATTTLLEAMSEAFPGIPNTAVFGQSEMSPTTCVLEGADAVRKLGSVGKPVPAVRVRVVDEDMNDVAPGEVGEIVYRGATLMTGYWNKPEATAEAFAGGWFHSGDLVRRDEEGFVYVVDRAKDMIISGGENIYSAEVESAAASHPAIERVAVVGRPHERWGEVPVAVVTLVPGATLTLDELRDWCGERALAQYKLPRDLLVLDELPVNASGKIVKARLREVVAS